MSYASLFAFLRIFCVSETTQLMMYLLRRQTQGILVMNQIYGSKYATAHVYAHLILANAYVQVERCYPMIWWCFKQRYDIRTKQPFEHLVSLCISFQLWLSKLYDQLLVANTFDRCIFLVNLWSMNRVLFQAHLIWVGACQIIFGTRKDTYVYYNDIFSVIPQVDISSVSSVIPQVESEEDTVYADLTSTS